MCVLAGQPIGPPTRWTRTTSHRHDRTSLGPAMCSMYSARPHKGGPCFERGEPTAEEFGGGFLSSSRAIDTPARASATKPRTALTWVRKPLSERLYRSGANGIRTRGLFHAMEARYQLRHSPSAAEATSETLPQPHRRVRTQAPGRSPSSRPGAEPSEESSSTGASIPDRSSRGQSRQSRSSAYNLRSSSCCTCTTTSL